MGKSDLDKGAKVGSFESGSNVPSNKMCIRDRLVICAVVVQQMLVPPGDQLGGVQPGQQVQGDGVFDHGKMCIRDKRWSWS